MHAPNIGKKLHVRVENVDYMRIPIRTHLISEHDSLSEVVLSYGHPLLQPGDILFVSEKIVAISQGRSYHPSEIEPRPLATFLSRHVRKTPTGIGLGMPETMEMALREVGSVRILVAAVVAAITKTIGRRGDFYRIAGARARAIDGPTSGTIPPYDDRIVLAPEYPTDVASTLKIILGEQCEVLIVDINDLGGNILGTTMSRRYNRRWLDVLRDNPLGQGTQSTPLGIIRARTSASIPMPDGGKR